MPLQFYNLLHGIDLSYPWIFRIDLHAALMAPDEDKNRYPPHPDPLPPRGEERKEKIKEKIKDEILTTSKSEGSR